MNDKSNDPEQKNDALLFWAKRAFDIASVHCGACADYHATWIYRRYAGVVGGIEADGVLLENLCRQVMEFGRRRWLIVGSADIGQLDLLKRASGDKIGSLDVTIVDQCVTPLRLCEDYANSYSIKLKTLQTDIREIGIHLPFDAILLHSVLAFLNAEEQLDVLSKLGLLLKQNGYMIICSRIGIAERESSEDRFERNKIGLARAIENGLDLPEGRQQFVARLKRLADRHIDWDDTPESHDEFVKLIERAGLGVQNILSSGQSARNLPFVGQGSKSRVIVTATRNAP